MCVRNKKTKAQKKALREAQGMPPKKRRGKNKMILRI